MSNTNAAKPSAAAGTASSATDNVDPAEIAKFEAMAARWWDPDSEFKPLHDINGPRLDFIGNLLSLAGTRALDIGCGGGLLTEGLASRGAEVTGIDMGRGPLNVARLHAAESGVEVRYIETSAEAMAAAEPEQFDLVTCLEMLEHVPDVGAVVKAAAQLAKPGGTLVFSTINRTPESYALAIVGAEYVLGLLPRGTHDWQKFIKPAELARYARDAELVVGELAGMRYNPFSRSCTLNKRLGVNYLLAARKPANAVSGAASDRGTNGASCDKGAA